MNNGDQPIWICDDECNQCSICHKEFGLIFRRHHCRNCGEIFCNSCCSNYSPIPNLGYETPVRVCDRCYLKSRGSKSNSAMKLCQTDYVEYDYFLLERHTLSPLEAASLRNSDSTDHFPFRISRPLPSQFWLRDSLYSRCGACSSEFTLLNRRHHCRGCGEIFCNKCTRWRHKLEILGYNNSYSNNSIESTTPSDSLQSSLKSPILPLKTIRKTSLSNNNNNSNNNISNKNSNMNLHRVCENCYNKYSIVNPIDIFQAIIRIKIASYLPPKSICQLSVVNHEWYRILTSEEADKILWGLYVDKPLTSPNVTLSGIGYNNNNNNNNNNSNNNAYKRLKPPPSTSSSISVESSSQMYLKSSISTTETIDKFGRNWFNSYLYSFVVKSDFKLSISFLKWPNHIIKEQAAAFICEKTSNNSENRLILVKERGVYLIIKILSYLNISTQTSMLSSHFVKPKNYKFVEYLLGILMNIATDTSEDFNPIRKEEDGLPVILKYLSSCPSRDKKFHKILLRCLGCLLNITNCDQKSCAILGQFGLISTLLKFLSHENEEISARSSAVLSSLIRRVKENQDDFRECGAIPMIITIIQNYNTKKYLCTYLKTLRNCCYQNLLNQIEFRKNKGLDIFIEILLKSENSKTEIFETIITTFLYCVTEDKESISIITTPTAISRLIYLISTSSDFYSEKVCELINQICDKNSSSISLGSEDINILIQKVQKYKNKKVKSPFLNYCVNMFCSLYKKNILSTNNDNFELIKSIFEDVSSCVSDEYKNELNKILNM